ncbi:MAG: hypothetical protein ACRC62_23490 [Microcoleus sp.]
MSQLLFAWVVEFVKCGLTLYAAITIFEAIPGFFGIKISSLKHWRHIVVTSAAVTIYILSSLYLSGARLSMGQILLYVIVYFSGSIVGLLVHKFWPLDQVVRR